MFHSRNLTSTALPSAFGRREGTRVAQGKWNASDPGATQQWSRCASVCSLCEDVYRCQLQSARLLPPLFRQKKQMDSHHENEWNMQERLTGLWAADGAEIENTRHFLVAWEVMTTWEINDSTKNWRHPSIDFLFARADGAITVVEMKRRVGTPKSSWEALSQVTHRAVKLQHSCNYKNLNSAHLACHSGSHGRVSGADPQELLKGHWDFFGLSRPLAREDFGNGPWRRVVAAKEFGSSWHGILKQFNSLSLFDIKERIQGSYPKWEASREFRRLSTEVDQSQWDAFATPINAWTLAP